MTSAQSSLTQISNRWDMTGRCPASILLKSEIYIRPLSARQDSCRADNGLILISVECWPGCSDNPATAERKTRQYVGHIWDKRLVPWTELRYSQSGAHK